MRISILVSTGFLFGSCFAQEIRQQVVTTEELASALGVVPFCADLALDGTTYPRLVAEIKDKEGRVIKQDVTPYLNPPAKNYRIRIFLFQDAQTHVPNRLIFNLSSEGNVAGNAFIDFPEGSRLAQRATSNSDSWFYRIWTFGPNPPKNFFQVTFRIETSAVPYTPPSSTIIIKENKKMKPEQGAAANP